MSNGHNGHTAHESPSAIGSMRRQQPEDISDFGLQFTLGQFEAGRTMQLGYTVRCSQKGNWENTPVANAANSGLEEVAVTVGCR